eukprot:TRINITY_DN33883_c0_g1_i1.p1 TRINITY_DN33883_c0_g1~~TRINITY_DN33883_c0_g1_i1.p1  ORF type:complete len:276 (+),score=70.97 TRINITY_DN33883_c0_g1_i1:79-906(+)
MVVLEKRGYQPTGSLQAVAPMVTSSAVVPVPLYDQFSIGWNEIFDPGPVKGEQSSVSGNHLPEQRSRQAAGSKSTAAAASITSTGQKRVGFSAASPTNASQALDGGESTLPPVAAENGGIWTSEVLTSKKPPAYLRIPGSKSSAVDASLKEHLLRCPPSRLRKPSEIMEVELNQLRWTLTEQHQEKRKQARKMRRLHRKCRVRPHEDIEQLEDRYGPEQGHLAPLQDPVERLECRVAKPSSARDFFVGLGRRHVGLAKAQGWEIEEELQMPLTAR